MQQAAITYRRIAKREFPFLEEMLYEALFVPPEKPKFPKSIIENPAIKKYVANWNQKKDDVAFVAVDREKLVGAIWGRKFPALQKGYGFIDEDTPEISMAVLETYRNKGIGSTLLQKIEKEYRELGVCRISLSVDKLNPATALYQRNGFVVFDDAGTALTMVKNIA